MTQLDDRLRVEITTVKDPGQGSGGRRKEATLGHVPLMTFLEKKQSVVRIRNQDELCCARAIVTMQAWTDEQPPRRRTPEVDFRSLKEGYPARTRLAKALHALARVPEGPCGLGALEQFQIVLPDYYIKVLSAELGFQVIFGLWEKRADQRYLLLLKHDDHHYGLKSLSAILGRSYYCHVCDKGNDHEDFQHHSCVTRRCVACKQKHCREYLAILPGDGKPPPTDASPLSGLSTFLLRATLLREPSGVFAQRARSRYPGTCRVRLSPKVQIVLQIPQLVNKSTQTSTPSQVPDIRVQNLQGCGGGRHPPMLHATDERSRPGGGGRRTAPYQTTTPFGPTSYRPHRAFPVRQRQRGL